MNVKIQGIIKREGERREKKAMEFFLLLYNNKKKVTNIKNSI
jgi:hypothetical protein